MCFYGDYRCASSEKLQKKLAKFLEISQETKVTFILETFRRHISNAGSNSRLLVWLNIEAIYIINVIDIYISDRTTSHIYDKSNTVDNNVIKYEHSVNRERIGWLTDHEAIHSERSCSILTLAAFSSGRSFSLGGYMFAQCAVPCI